MTKTPANPIKGEVTFDWQGTSYTMVLNTNARIGMEGAYGRGFASIALDALGVSGAAELPADATELQQILAQAKTMEIGHLRQFMFHALRANHPDVDINQVGFMMDDLGLAEVTEMVRDMIALSEPAPVAGDAPVTGEAGKAPTGKTPKG